MLELHANTNQEKNNSVGTALSVVQIKGEIGDDGKTVTWLQKTKITKSRNY